MCREVVDLYRRWRHWPEGRFSQPRPGSAARWSYRLPVAKPKYFGTLDCPCECRLDSLRIGTPLDNPVGRAERLNGSWPGCLAYPETTIWRLHPIWRWLPASPF